MKPTRALVMTLALLLVLPALALPASRTVTLWYPGGDITAGVNDFADPKLWADFEAKNDVKVQAVALDYETMKQKMLAAAAGRNIADILFVDDTFVAGFVKEGLLDPMEDSKAKAWLGAVMPEIKLRSDYGGQMWGYPQYGGDTYALTWNKDHFKEAGLDPERPPKTWAEFREYAKKLTKR
ncbi:MAG: extracellular solute-binding protein, partial [Acidobacteria bacterium]